MCQRATCSKCQKPSFVGCGRHVERVLAGVAVSDRCACRGIAVDRDGGAPAQAGGWRRLFGLAARGRERRQP